MDQVKKIKFSNQSLGAFMMLLQKCLAEETDIVPMLLDLDFALHSRDDAVDELVCLNPPVIYIPNGELEADEDELDFGVEI